MKFLRYVMPSVLQSHSAEIRTNNWQKQSVLYNLRQILLKSLKICSHSQYFDVTRYNFMNEI